MGRCYSTMLCLVRRHLLMCVFVLIGISSTALPPQAAGLDEEAASPLQYYDWSKTASAESIAAERARIAEDTLTTDPMISAVQLGLLLSSPALSSPSTEREALALLDAALRQPVAMRSNLEYRSFAGFLRAHLQQRAELRSAEAAAVAGKEQIDSLQDSLRQLQDKISALTSIEEQLIQREQGQRP